ncbi:MAG: asparaginase [Beijerinckiaceae bacterium]
MTNPVLVDVMRGGIVESSHRGAVAVVDADGAVVLSIGDIDRPIFPRSAIKGLQAIPLIESGAADKYQLTDDEIALACASHNGEERHAQTALGMLAKAGLGVGALECGAQFPMRANAGHPLIREGKPATALHNNCSGKHSGFVCVACASGDDPAGYIKASHPTMRAVTEAVASMTGHNLSEAVAGTDGCSIPTFAIPLRALALGFARFGAGAKLGGERQKATARIRAAVANAPFFVAGTERFDTEVMQVLGTRAFLKVGAEGVYCASFPDLGFGVALKCDDGTTRAAEVMMAAVIKRYLGLSDDTFAAMARWHTQPLTNWNGIHVGDIRPAGLLAVPLAG